MRLLPSGKPATIEISVVPAFGAWPDVALLVSKDWEASDVATAVRMIGLGMTMFPPKSDQPAPLLTGREREVLDLIAAGSTNPEIAQRLFLSPHTVKEHTSALYRKLGARNRAEAVQRAQRIGLLG